MAHLFRIAPWKRGLRTLAERFPLTAGGFCYYLVVGLVLYLVGLKHSDMVLLLATLCLLVVAVLAQLAVLEATWTTSRRYRRNPAGGHNLQLVAGRAGWTGWTFKGLWRPFVEVTWTWVEPANFTTETTRGRDGLVEMVTPARRCLVERVVREFVVRDVLGIADIRWRVTVPSQVTVVPEPTAVDETTIVFSLFGGDEISDPFGEPVGDRVDMRRYTAGDPPRLILWKVFARSRKLLVRVPERALMPTPRTCAYLVAGPGDEPCAALARSIIERDLLGQGWRFGADGSRGHAQSVPEALEILARSGNPESRQTCSLGNFLETAYREGYQSCLVLVPSGAGPWLESARASIARSPMRLTLLGVPAAGQTVVRKRAGWEKWVFFGDTQEETEPSDVMDRLRGREVTQLLYDPATRRITKRFIAQGSAARAAANR